MRCADRSLGFVQLALAAGALLLAAPRAHAQAPFFPDKPAFLDDFTGSVVVTSDYVFRGISQTRGNPAVQGALEWAPTFEQSFLQPYLGVFGSNVKFPNTADNSNINDQNIEVDLYGGVRFELHGVKLDIGYVRYWYPGFEKGPTQPFSPDWGEGYIKAGYDFGFAAASAAYFYSAEFQLDSGTAHYVNLGVDVPMPWAWDVVLGARLGRQWVAREVNFGFPDYFDWNVTLSKELWGFTFAVGYYDTDISEGDTLENPGTGAVNAIGYKIVRPRFAGSATWKF